MCCVQAASNTRALLESGGDFRSAAAALVKQTKLETQRQLWHRVMPSKGSRSRVRSAKSRLVLGESEPAAEHSSAAVASSEEESPASSGSSGTEGHGESTEGSSGTEGHGESTEHAIESWPVFKLAENGSFELDHFIALCVSIILFSLLYEHTLCSVRRKMQVNRGWKHVFAKVPRPTSSA